MIASGVHFGLLPQLYGFEGQAWRPHRGRVVDCLTARGYFDGGHRLEDCFRNRCNRQKHFRNFNIDKNYFRIINLQILSQKLLNILSCSTDGYILGLTPCLTDCRGPTIITFAPASAASTDSKVLMTCSRHCIQRFRKDSRGPTTQSTPANRTTPVLMPILIGSTIGSTTFCSSF